MGLDVERIAADGDQHFSEYRQGHGHQSRPDDPRRPPGRSFNPKANGNDNPRSEKYRRVHQTIGTPAASVEMPAKRDSFGSRKVVARPMRRKPNTPRTKSPRPSCCDQRGGKGASPTTNERRLVRTLPRTIVPSTSKASCPRINLIQRSSNASPRATMAASALAWMA